MGERAYGLFFKGSNKKTAWVLLLCPWTAIFLVPLVESFFGILTSGIFSGNGGNEGTHKCFQSETQEKIKRSGPGQNTHFKWFREACFNT